MHHDTFNPIKEYNNYIIDKAKQNQEKRKREMGGYIPASQSGMCHRNHFYLSEGQDRKPFVKSSLRIMRLGTVMGEEFEKAMNYWFEKLNWNEDKKYHGEIHQEVYMTSDTLGIAGHMDLLFVYNRVGYLYDWKTANSFKFKMLFNSFDGSPSINYELQLASYGLLAMEEGLCDSIAHLGLLYYNKDNSVIKEKLVPLEYMDKTKMYWDSVKESTNNLTNPPQFGLGKSPVYKWECGNKGKYCDYSHVCPSPLLQK